MEKFCLRWNDFEKNISEAFKDIKEEKDFFDCTLSCGTGNKQLKAHKLILSACSPFFRTVLKQNPHQHPLLFLKGVEYNDLLSVLNFMYHGEVNVAQEDLNSFLAVAEDLQIKGLTQNNSEKSEKQSTKQILSSRTETSSSIGSKSRVVQSIQAPIKKSSTEEEDDIHEIAITEIKKEQESSLNHYATNVDPLTQQSTSNQRICEIILKTDKAKFNML